MAYATPGDLADAIAPATLPANAYVLLDRASRDVDTALLTAIYDVDDDGLPTNTAVIDALRDATVEQAAYRIGRGETTGLAGGYDSVTIGSVKLDKGNAGASSASSGTTGALSTQAWQILATAGLTGTGPIGGY